MYSTSSLALVLAFWFLNLALSANAGLYVIQPSVGSTCHGGQSCTIEWLDDGLRPLLTALGVCTVGLYTGNQQLVQELEPVDVSNSRSTTFTPNPRAGPNSNTYYIALTSTSFKQPDGTLYIAFSPFLSIDHMSGSFQTPLPAATSTHPLPSSLTRSNSSATNSILSTITVGTLSTSPTPQGSSTQSSSPSSPTYAPSPSATRMSTSTSPSSTPSSSLSGSITVPSSTSSNSTGAAPVTTSASSDALGLIPVPMLSILPFVLALSCFL